VQHAASKKTTSSGSSTAATSRPLVLARHRREVVATLVRLVGASDPGNVGRQAVAAVARELVDVRLRRVKHAAGRRSV
jgi:hypothetical protein